MRALTLPGPEGPLKLHLNLALVAALEDAGGSLLKAADRLVAQEMKVSEMMPVLSAAYRAAGCTLAAEALGEFILSRAPAALLAELLMAILAPLAEAGAVTPGEAACRGL